MPGYPKSTKEGYKPLSIKGNGWGFWLEIQAFAIYANSNENKIWNVLSMSYLWSQHKLKLAAV